jgi:hypothetical protein
MADQKIVIYKNENNEIELRADVEKQTLWLSQKQMSQLFGKDTDTIGLHIKNIYESGELNESSTTEDYSVVQKEGTRKVKRTIKHYNLDVIISVGYRVNSKRGTQFRIWATNTLRKYLVEGYAINKSKIEKDADKLQKLQGQLETLKRVNEFEDFSKDEAKELIRLITEYSGALELIDQYDHDKIEPAPKRKGKTKRIKYTDAKQDIDTLRKELGATELFGNERDSGLESVLENIFQTFDGKDLYPTLKKKT